MYGQFKASCCTAIYALLFFAHSSAAEDVLRSPKLVGDAPPNWTRADQEFLNEVQQNCFRYLWSEVGDGAQLVRDRLTTEVSSTAGVGFQLSSLPIGVERGWVTRQQAESRALAILRALARRKDNRKFGIYIHYVDRHSGGVAPQAPTVQASTVDHALLQSGAITAAMYFGGEVRELADQMIRQANWAAFAGGNEPIDGGDFQSGKPGQLSFGWRATDGKSLEAGGAFRPWRWHVASAEEQLVYFMAVGSPTEEHAVVPEVYYGLTRKVGQHKDDLPYVVSWNGTMFTYFFAHCWLDFARFEADDPSAFGCEGPRVDWFENSRRAFATHRRQCIEHSDQFASLGPDLWGLGPCIGWKAQGQTSYLVQDLLPNHSGVEHWRGGTVAPYVAAAAMPFMPAESLAALRKMQSLRNKAGAPLVWPEAGDSYGLRDSFNIDQDYAPKEYIAIDVGPMLLMIENARTGLIWRLFHEHPASQRAVDRLRWKLHSFRQ